MPRQSGYLVLLSVFVPVNGKDLDSAMKASETIKAAQAGDFAGLLGHEVSLKDYKYTTRLAPKAPVPAPTPPADPAQGDLGEAIKAQGEGGEPAGGIEADPDFREVETSTETAGTDETDPAADEPATSGRGRRRAA